MMEKYGGGNGNLIQQKSKCKTEWLFCRYFSIDNLLCMEYNDENEFERKKQRLFHLSSLAVCSC